MATQPITILPAPEARRALRLAHGLTLRDVGARLDCDAATVLKWERGRKPSRAFLRRYAKYLDELRAGLATAHTEALR